MCRATASFGHEGINGVLLNVKKLGPHLKWTQRCHISCHDLDLALELAGLCVLHSNITSTKARCMYSHFSFHLIVWCVVLFFLFICLYSFFFLSFPLSFPFCFSIPPFLYVIFILFVFLFFCSFFLLQLGFALFFYCGSSSVFPFLSSLCLFLCCCCLLIRLFFKICATIFLDDT